MRRARFPLDIRARQAGLVAILLAGILTCAALLAPRTDAPAGQLQLPDAVDVSAPADARRVAGAAAATARDAVAPRRGTGHYWAPQGSRFAFRLTGSTTYGLEVEDEGAARTESMRLRFGANMLVDVLGRRDGEIAVGLQLADCELSGPGGGADPELARQAAAMAHPVILRLRDDGTLAGYRFDEAVDAEQRNFVRAIVSAISFTVPADAAETWEADGDDATGRFVAKYTELDTGDVDFLAVGREKLRYVAMADALGEPPAHELDGGASARLSRAIGWLCDAKVDERLSMSMPMLEGRVVLHLAATLRLTESLRTPASAAFAGDPWAGTWAPASGSNEVLAADTDAAERQRWQAELRGVRLDDVVAELVALLAAEKIESREYHDAWTKLIAMIELRPQVAAEIRQLLVAGQAAGPLADALLTALGGAGTPAAQAALAALRADRGLAASLRESATVAMVQLAEPTTEVVESLRNELAAARDLRGAATAMMVLGTLAPRHETPLADGTTAMQSLVALEDRARALGSLDTWLDSLGNAGTPEVLPHVRRFLDHGDESVRESATFALRHVPGDDAARDLIRMAGGDESPLVRARALEVLGRREGAAARDALRRAAQHDPEVSVRRSAILALGSGLEGDAPSRRALQEIARDDRDAGMRGLARRMLDSIRK